jgi:propionyl-CoA carboxylase alpha chain
MVAKVIAHAATRAEAAAVLAAALREAQIDGLRTNRDFLVRLLEDPAFLAGDVDTHFLERPEATGLVAALLGDGERRAALAAAALAGQAERREAAPVQGTLPSGWRNNPGDDQVVRYADGEDEHEVGYRFRRGALERGSVDGVPLAESVRLLAATPEMVVLELDGLRSVFGVRRGDGGAVHVSGPGGQLDVRELERYPDPSSMVAPGSLLAPMPGSVIRVDVAVGDRVTEGQPLLALEAMKMEHEIVATADGVVTTLSVQVGSQVDAGALLAAIDDEG